MNDKTIVLNTVSPGWKDIDITSPIYKLAWTQIVNAIAGSWGVGSIDSVDGSTGSWTRFKDRMNFRIVITPTTTGNVTFTLPFVPKEPFLLYLYGSYFEVVKCQANTNLITLSLTKDIQYVLEGNNIIL